MASIATMQNQLSQTKEGLARLQREKDGLHRMLSDVSGDRQTFLGQLGAKRAKSSKMASVANSTIATDCAQQMKDCLGSGFEGRVLQSIDAMIGQIRRAINDVEEEMLTAQRRIRSLQKDIAEEKERVRKEEERKREQEKKEREARENKRTQ